MKKFWKKALAIVTSAAMVAGVIATGGLGQEITAKADDRIDYKSILGEAVNYGVVSATFEQGNDLQTNFATKSFVNNASAFTKGDLAGEEKLNYIIGSIDAPILKIANGEVDNSKIFLIPKKYYDDTTLFNHQDGGSAETVTRIAGDYTTDDVNSKVDEMIDHAYRQSESLNELTPDCVLNDVLVTDPNSYVLDVTGITSNPVVITIPATDIDNTKKLLANNDALNIKKNRTQTVVFNVLSSDITVNKFDVIVADEGDKKVTSDTNTSRTSHNDEVNDYICKSVVFNLVNATLINLQACAGIYLAPQPLAVINETSGSGAGWIVTAGKFYNSNAEWHYIDNDHDANYTPSLGKTPSTGSNPTYQYEFTKYDDTNKIKVDGAKMTLYKTVNNQDTAVETWTSSTTQVYTFDVDANCDYHVVETEVPAGYKKASKVDFKFHVCADGSVTVTSGTISSSTNATVDQTGKIVFHNDPITVKVTVTDENTGKVVPGARVKIKKPDGKEETLTTDSEGKVTASPVPAGPCTITVTDVPEGYEVTKNKEQKATIIDGGTNEFVAEVGKTDSGKQGGTTTTTTSGETTTAAPTTATSTTSTTATSTTSTTATSTTSTTAAPTPANVTSTNTTTSTKPETSVKTTSSLTKQPKTGDKAPIAVVLAVMIVAVAGIFVVLKKKKNN